MNTQLAAHFARELGRPLRLFVASGPAPEIVLAGAELEPLRTMDHPRRQREWLRGRCALRRALAHLGRDPDTSRLSLPDRGVSLTHSTHHAIALAVPGVATGVGIDHEPLRTVDPRMARWYLRRDEQRWLAHCTEAERTAQMLRLWTIKEALFKAQPCNRGLQLIDFELEEPAALCGSACVRGRPSVRARYCTRAALGGVLTVAITEERNDDTG